jgi:hypothetical protein
MESRIVYVDTISTNLGRDKPLLKLPPKPTILVSPFKH